MREYHNNDDPGSYGLSYYDTVITDYQSGSYDGSGEAFCIYDKEGVTMIDVYNLEHCSCYGPWDNGVFDSFPLSDYLAGKVGTDSSSEYINKMMRELYG